MVNAVMLVGYLGKDPELKDASVPVCKFSLATSEKRKGEKITQWHNVTCFNKTAEFCGQYLKKGALVHVEGKIDYQTWEKDGVKQYRTEIIANRVQSLGGKGDAKAEEKSDLPF